MRHNRLLLVACLFVLSGAALVLSQAGLTANAGPDQNDALVGAVVSLNGAGSVGATSYAWAFTSRPAGSSAVLSGVATAAPTFTPDRNGTYVIRLTVGNGTASATDSVSVTTVNRAPEAVAGPDAALAVGKSITLNGTGSFDPDNDKLTYAWSIVSRPEASAGSLSSATKSKAKLLLDRGGTYVVQLVVRDGVLSSPPDQVVITTTNTAPVANAGPDRVVPLSTVTQLDGTASSDVDGDPLTYSWKLKRPKGSSAVLANATTPRPTLVPDFAGSYVATLTVADGVLSRSDAVTISTGVNVPPVARAGRDHAALVAGQKIVLDGSASTDANGDALTYSWTITKRPGSSSALLGSANTPRATFTADVKGTYTFTLTVTDGSGAVRTHQIAYGVALPMADAGPDQSVFAGDMVTLDGSASSHLAGSVWYGWSLASTPAGSTAALSDPADPQPQFVADLAGTYIAQLVVFDGARLSAADTVVVTVGDNFVPRVDLGPDQVVSPSTTVTFDSDAVTDPDPGALTLRWALLARPAGSASALTAGTGTVSQLTVDVAGAYVVQLVATDQDGGSATRTAVVTTAKGRPTVDVGPDRGATAGTPVPLAALVAEPDGTGVTHAWRLLSRPDGSAASISSPGSATPTFTPDHLDGVYVAQDIVTDPDGLEAIDAAVVRAQPQGTVPVVTIEATDSTASEFGADPGTFTFTRSGSTSLALTGVAYTRTGSATPGTDFTPALPASATVDFAAGEATATVTITPIDDGVAGEGDEEVVLTLVDGASYDLGTPSTATVTIADTGNTLANAATHLGSIVGAGEVDEWTFPANAGDRIAVHIGEIADTSGDFTPWIRLRAPSGALVASNWGTAATRLEAAASQTGVYTILVASNDTGLNGTGTYRLTEVDTPGPYTVSAGDQGGALVNGAVHTGEIVRGDVDVWTVSLTAGQRLAVHLAETADTSGDFTPWVRLWAPSGASIAGNWGNAATRLEAVAAETGVYTLLVASNDTGDDGTGQYRLEVGYTPGPYTVSGGDQGGSLVNGAVHTGGIVRGDVDVWTISLTAGQRLAVHLAEATDTSGDFTPWVRLWAPSGASIAGNWGNAATRLEAVAAETGVYTLLVASNDTGDDGTGQYRLEVARTPGPYTVSAGDQGDVLVNGAVHTGEIVRGDVDVWTVSLTAGQRLAVHLAETTDTSGDFTPWVRLWAPSGASIAGNWGNAATRLEAVAAETGVYTLLVASNDTGDDGTGQYRLEVAYTPGPFSTSAGDQGASLVNGAVHTGEIVRGDVDVWTVSLTAGQRLAVHLAETTDTSGDFTPWVRLWAPSGASIAGNWGNAATRLEAVAAETGVYTVLVASNDTGDDGTGQYRLEVTYTPGPFSISAGDQGGGITSGAPQAAQIVRGDVDGWTINAVAGQSISVTITETLDSSGDFTPWIRVWSPTGASLAGNWGAASATVNLVAPVTGAYSVLAASNDTGDDGTGNYTLSVTVGP